MKLVHRSAFTLKEVSESLCNSENVLFSGSNNSVSSIVMIKVTAVALISGIQTSGAPF